MMTNLVLDKKKHGTRNRKHHQHHNNHNNHGIRNRNQRGSFMTLEKTYEKREGIMYLRVIEKKEDIKGVTFTTKDAEVVFDYKKHLPQLGKRLVDIQEEITDLQTDEARLIIQIEDINAAADSDQTLQGGTVSIRSK